jgi:hypothetical protein
MFTTILRRGQYILLSFGLDFKASVKKFSIKINKGLFKKTFEEKNLATSCIKPENKFWKPIKNSLTLHPVAIRLVSSS